MNFSSGFTYLVVFLTVLFCSNTTWAQRTDTLKEVEITTSYIKDTVIDEKADFSATQTLQSIDKPYKDLYESQSLANLLSQQTSVFVKSYGINSLATLSLKGASAAQSAVLWNGVPVMNPALGVADLSLLQTGLFDDVALKYGGSAALYGSGNVGGALFLGNEQPNFSPGRKAGLSLGIGSFGSKNAGLSTAFQNKKWSLRLNGFYQQAKNDIVYKDVSGNSRRLDNAALRGGGGLLAIDYNLKDKWASQENERLYLKLWWQSYKREIPPAMFEAFSDKQQEDISLRTVIGYEKNTRKTTLYAKGAYSNEFLHYQDSAVAQDNKNRVHQLYQETGFKYVLSNTANGSAVHQLLVFVPVLFSFADGDNISSRETQFRPAFAAAYSYEGPGNRLRANASLRQEFVNGKKAPLLPGIGASYKLLVKENGIITYALLMKANVQRTYRIPTLNELYYFPGGNPGLKPEQGWGQDGGYVFQLSGDNAINNRWSVQHEVNVFNRNIQDWIYWLGGAIWTPHNIAKVHSRGVETNNKVTYTAGFATLHLGLNYIYVLSTTEASYLPGDGSIGKQIPYTPRYNVQGNIGFEWKDHLFLNFNQTYTGYRFVTVDESQYLAPYATSNIQASYRLTFTSSYGLQVTGQLQNVFNTGYHVVNARPMPGRNFLLQLKCFLQ